MKILLVGPTGSVVELVQEELRKLGASPVKLYTTAPKPSEDDDTYIYISESDVINYPEKSFETTKDGYSYFATERQLEENDVLIVAPGNINTIAKQHEDMAFAVIYITDDGSDEAIASRRIRTGLSVEDFDEIRKSEDPVFANFDARVDEENCMNEFADNIYILSKFAYNGYEDISIIASTLMNTFRYQRNLQVILQDAVIHSVLPINEDGKIVINYMDENGEPDAMEATPDLFACKLMHESNANMLQYLASAYFGHHDLKVNDNDE